MTIPDCPLGQTIRLADRILALKLQAYRIQNRKSWTVGRLEYPDSFRRADQVGSIKEIKYGNPIYQLA